MRVVIKVGTAALQDDLILGEFAKALRQLVSEGHQVILVHGSVINSASRTNGNGIQMPPPLASLPKTECSTVAAGRFNQHLIACLGRVGVPAIGLFGGDGNVIAAKTAEAGAYSNGYILEVASVDPFWLDVVCRSGGVPVIANVALAADDSYHSVSADQMAAACAIGWQANALIFLTGGKGIHDKDGKIIRWLEAEQINLLVTSSIVADKVLPKLVACHDALKQGVHRVRIFPVSHIQSLPSFFMERLDCGTEIIISPQQRYRADLAIPSSRKIAVR